MKKLHELTLLEACLLPDIDIKIDVNRITGLITLRACRGFEKACWYLDKEDLKLVVQTLNAKRTLSLGSGEHMNSETEKLKAELVAAQEEIARLRMGLGAMATAASVNNKWIRAATIQRAACNLLDGKEVGSLL